MTEAVVCLTGAEVEALEAAVRLQSDVLLRLLADAREECKAATTFPSAEDALDPSEIIRARRVRNREREAEELGMLGVAAPGESKEGKRQRWDRWVQGLDRGNELGSFGVTFGTEDRDVPEPAEGLRLAKRDVDQDARDAAEMYNLANGAEASEPEESPAGELSDEQLLAELGVDVDAMPSEVCTEPEPDDFIGERMRKAVEAIHENLLDRAMRYKVEDAASQTEPEPLVVDTPRVLKGGLRVRGVSKLYLTFTREAAEAIGAYYFDGTAGHELAALQPHELGTLTARDRQQNAGLLALVSDLAPVGQLRPGAEADLTWDGRFWLFRLTDLLDWHVPASPEPEPVPERALAPAVYDDVLDTSSMQGRNASKMTGARLAPKPEPPARHLVPLTEPNILTGHKVALCVMYRCMGQGTTTDMAARRADVGPRALWLLERQHPEWFEWDNNWNIPEQLSAIEQKVGEKVTICED